MSQIVEQVSWEGRILQVSWVEDIPPRELVTQVSGVCFTPEGKLVLVAGDDKRWTLPGGHPEEGETLEQVLQREVMEEACAVVEDAIYLGAQQVDDPDCSTELKRYYQTRFYARVLLQPFEPEFETLQRIEVEPGEFLQTLAWGHTPIAQVLFSAALQMYRRQ